MAASPLPILSVAPRLDDLPPAANAATLDAIWRELNALGGYFDPSDREAAARDAMLGQCLAIVERFGGRDPITRPSILARRHAERIASRQER